MKLPKSLDRRRNMLQVKCFAQCESSYSWLTVDFCEARIDDYMYGRLRDQAAPCRPCIDMEIIVV